MAVKSDLIGETNIRPSVAHALYLADATKKYYPKIKIVSEVQYIYGVDMSGGILTLTPFIGSDQVTYKTYLYTSLLLHSSGCLCYKYEDKYIFSDVDRINFTTVDLSFFDFSFGSSLAESPNGGIYNFYCKTGSTYYLAVREMSVSGNFSDSSEILICTLPSYALTGWLNRVKVKRLPSGDYLVVYNVVSYIGDSSYDNQYNTFFYMVVSSDFSSYSSIYTLFKYRIYPDNVINELDFVKHDIDAFEINVIDETGEIFIFFHRMDYYSGSSYSTIMNLYYFRSVDNGSTWEGPINLTNNTPENCIFSLKEYPFILKREASNYLLLYSDTEQSGYLTTKNENSPIKDDYYGNAHFSFNPVTRNILGICSANPGFWIFMCSADDWTLTRSIHEDSESSIPLPFTYFSIKGIRTFPGYVVVWSDYAVTVYSEATNTFREYYFKDYPAYGAVKNVDYDFTYSWINIMECSILDCYIDLETKRLYILWGDGYIWVQQLRYGYISLEDPGDYEHYYTYNPLWGIVNGPYSEPLVYASTPHIKPQFDEGYLIISSTNVLSATTGWIAGLLIMAQDKVYKFYTVNDFPAFPKQGVYAVGIANNKFYGSCYDFLDNELAKHKKGLMIIDLGTDIITYKYPSWGTYNDYQLTDGKFIENKTKIIFASPYGTTIYNIIDDTWYLYDKLVYRLGSYTSSQTLLSSFKVDYDEVNDVAFASSTSAYGWHPDNPHPTLLVAELGSGFKKTIYGIESPNLTFDFDNSYKVTTNSDVTHPLAFFDPEFGFLTLFADYLISSETSFGFYRTIYSGVEDISYDVTKFVVLDEEITVNRGVDGTPAKLTFSIADGIAFDPIGSSSILSRLFTLGRQISIYYTLMDTLSDGTKAIPNYIPFGKYFITGYELDHNRGDHPIARITAEDAWRLFDEVIVPVHFISNQNPSDAIKTILYNYTFFDEDYIAPIDGDYSAELNYNFSRISYSITHQFLDTSVKELVEEICYRFGYMPVIDIFGRFQVVPLDYYYDNIGSYDPLTSTGVSYTRDKVVSMSPDTSYSDFTNRITVTGEELNFIEVLHDEERVASLSGTVGWWCFVNHGDIHYTVRYSEDDSKRVIHPRLEVGRSTESIMFSLVGGISEKISDEDPDYKWCKIKISGPNLIPLLIVGIALIAAGMYVGDMVVAGGFIVNYGHTIPVGTAIAFTGTLIVSNILGSIVNFSYEVWGRPIGYVRRSISAYADDKKMQALVGCLVEKKIDGFLTNSVADCKFVADYEMKITQLQRNTCKLVLLPNLKLLEGDVIKFHHPNSGIALTMFVVKITRKFKATSSNDGDGYFLDEVEGWLLEPYFANL